MRVLSCQIRGVGGGVGGWLHIDCVFSLSLSLHKKNISILFLRASPLDILGWW
jgi:hypothetical protein